MSVTLPFIDPQLIETEQGLEYAHSVELYDKKEVEAMMNAHIRIIAEMQAQIHINKLYAIVCFTALFLLALFK